MVVIKNIILFISAVSATAIPKRTPTVLLDDIAAIGTNLNALTATVGSYTGGIVQGTTLDAAVAAVGASFKLAGTDASATSSLSTPDSKTVLNAILNLIPPFQNLLNAVLAKKKAFDDTGLMSTVELYLESLKNDTNTFGDGISAIVSSDVKPGVETAQIQMDTGITNAESAFEGGS